MRPIDKIIKAIKLLLPAEFDGKADFLYELDSIDSSAAYSSPENLGLSWDRLIETLETLGEADTDWKRKIQDLMSTKLDYRTVIGE